MAKVINYIDHDGIDNNKQQRCPGLSVNQMPSVCTSYPHASVKVSRSCKQLFVSLTHRYL